MQRRSFIKHAGIGLSATLAAVAAPAVHAQATIRWRMVSSYSTALPALYQTGKRFTEMVSRLTGGKFEITLYNAGELMPAFGVLDGVQSGTVECGYTAPYYYAGKDETFAIGAGIPFGLNTRQMISWMYEGNGLKLMREFMRNYDIINFPIGNTTAQMGGWYRKEIKSLDDVKGLKVRIAGLAGEVFSRMGAVTQQIPGPDIYTALEKGTIDAAEWVGPLDDLSLGLYKVAPHYYYPGWWEGTSQVDLYVNIKEYEKLPPEYQEIINAASGMGLITMQSMYDAQNPAALKELIAKGAKLHRFPKDIMDRALKEALGVYEEISAKNPNWKKVYTDYAKFRADENLWFRLAEGSYDSYMQSQKWES